MYFQQVSVFIENKPGALASVLEALAQGNVNVLSTHLSDTTEFGLLRLVVADPQQAQALLRKAGFATTLSEVFLTCIPHRPGALLKLMQDVTAAGLNLEYMYNVSITGDAAYVVLKFSHAAAAAELLVAHSIKTVGLDELPQ